MSETSDVHKDGKQEILNALFAAQSELSGIIRGNVNGRFDSKYADRTTVLQTVKPILQKHNIMIFQSFVQPPGEYDDDSIPLAMNTRLYHVPSGQYLESVAVVPLPQSDPQGYGSATTYISRYSLVTMLALPLLDDDDGNAASLPDKPSNRAEPPKERDNPVRSVEPAAREAAPPRRKLWGK